MTALLLAMNIIIALNLILKSSSTQSLIKEQILVIKIELPITKIITKLF